MSSFNQQVAANIKRVGQVAISSPPGNAHSRIKTLSGELINLKNNQIETINRQRAISRYQGQGNYQSALTSAANIDIPIRSGAGFGNVRSVHLKLSIINNTGASFEAIPVPFWINRIEWLNPQGNRILIQYSENLWLDTVNFTNQQWANEAILINAGPQWQLSGDVVANGESRNYYLVLHENFFQQTRIFTPAINGEITCRIWFNPSTQWLLSGSAPQISDLSLRFESPFMLTSDYNQIFNDHLTMPLDYRFYKNIIQYYTTNFGPNQQIDSLLSGFNGVFNEIEFFITTSNATQQDQLEYFPIEWFDILDSNGVSLTGGLYIYDGEARYIFHNRDFNNTQPQHLPLYRYSFSLAQASDRALGTLGGYYCFTGREVLRINTGPAQVNKVVTITPNINPTSGQYRFYYKNEQTSWLAYDANAAAIKSAIQNLPSFHNFDEVVTVSGPLSAGALTVTFSGRLQREEPLEPLYADGLLEGAGPANVYVSSVITTEPVDGFNPATQNYKITMIGKQATRLRLQPSGELTVVDT